MGEKIHQERGMTVDMKKREEKEREGIEQKGWTRKRRVYRKQWIR